MSVRIRLKTLIFIRNVKRWEFAFCRGERFENWDALIKSGDINICCMQYAHIKIYCAQRRRGGGLPSY